MARAAAKSKSTAGRRKAEPAPPATNDQLARYQAKRDFSKTSEPSGERALKPGRRFVVQHHWARRDHYDFRLELGGVLKSWAVTRGPSARPATKRLAVRTEDHPLDYFDFEGVIPQGEYGGGTVQVWDMGEFDALDADPLKALDKGVLKFRLHGERMKGEWALVRLRGGETRENWLLIKDRDDFAEKDDTLAARHAASVKTGRDREAITAGEAPTSFKKGVKTALAQQRKAQAARKTAQASIPAFVPPTLCETRAEPPPGDDWLHEMKYDGYRLQIALADGQARLYTREGLDWTERFPAIAAAAAKLKAQSAVLDGEAVVFDDKGLSDFPALVAALKGDRRGFSYAAFDLLRLDGVDLRRRPLLERKEKLKALLPRRDVLVYADHVRGEGDRVFAQAVAAGAEGIVSKRADAPYRSGRTPAWVKVKSRKRDDVTVIGWTRSDRGRRFAALVVAREIDGRLVFAGRVGTGFDDAKQKMLLDLLKPLARSAPPDVERLDLAPRGVQWVEPGLIVEVAMAGWTGDGQVRQGAYLGVREDRTAEVAKARGRAAKTVPRGERKAMKATGKTTRPPAADLSRLTHPERVLFPARGVTKQRLAEYLVAAAPKLGPHLFGRPVSFVRAPDGVEGERFFQRHALPGMSRGVAPVKAGRGKRDYIAVSDVDGLVTCAQFSVLELHGWCARADDIETPDRMVFDLDPDESLPFSRVKEGAVQVRDHLEAAGLKSFPLLSGGKGIHVVAPLTGDQDWPTVEAFAEGFAKRLAAADPARWVAVMTKSKRAGKIFLDYLRNKRSASAIVPYSPRARANAPVATPVSWAQLKKIDRADAFDIDTVLRRRGDPWKGFFDVEQEIGADVLKLVRGR